MKQKHNYFVLDKPSFHFGNIGLFLLKSPYLLIKWIISFILARNIAHLALDPNNTKKQSDFNLVHLANESETADDIVVINLFPHEPYKTLQDYLLHFSSNWFPLPFVKRSGKMQLHYNNQKDREYIDNLLNELDKILNNESQREKFQGKTFDWDRIHFKGIGCLDEKMRAYFLEKLQKKYGDAPFSTEKKHNLNFFSLETADYSVLDSVEVAGPGEEERPMSERKFVIACMARQQNYINWLKDFNYSANRIVGSTIIGFNYRGVDYSKGMVWTEQDMQADIKAQVQRLLQLGAKPENIGLEGMCVGAAMATISAAELHQENVKVKLYNERSFRSIPRFITGFMFPEDHESIWTPINLLRSIGGVLTFLITYPFIWIAGWHVDAAKAWDRIPFEDKDFSQIHRDADHTMGPQLDGVVHDSWASMASHVAEGQALILAKNEQELSEDERALMDEPLENHNFHIAPDNEARNPHTTARRHLTLTDAEGHTQSYSMHQHMIDSFNRMFSKNKSTRPVTTPPVNTETTTENKLPVKRRPLAIASSGGSGHIYAIQGIIDNLQADPNVELELTQHRARLYSQVPRSFTNGFLRLGVYLSSVWGIGYLINKIATLTNSFRLPDYELFWKEMERLDKTEREASSDPQSTPQGRMRPYIDMLLDVHTFGYSAAAMTNTLHRCGQIDDINLMIKEKEFNDQINYHVVYNYFLDKLIEAAKKNKPYTEIISTQPLFLPALCDAVIEYNQKYISSTSRSRNLQPIEIHQYLTDLPSIGCDHYLKGLAELTQQQKQQIRVYALNLRRPLLLSYFENGKDFKGLHNLSFKENPMVRREFKDPALTQYLSHDKELRICITTYSQNNEKTIWSKDSLPGEIVIPPNSKVAAIMISSLGSDTTIDYLKDLLNNDYDQIFVFGGLGDHIYSKVQEIIADAPAQEQEILRNRIILLGNQPASSVAPIMARSNCVTIRGGMIGMELAALPAHPNKAIFFDLANEVNYEALGPDINWEDGNAEELIAYFKSTQIYAMKTSPAQFSSDLSKIPADLCQINPMDEAEVPSKNLKPETSNLIEEEEEEEVDIYDFQARRASAANSTFGAGRIWQEKQQRVIPDTNYDGTRHNQTPVKVSC